MEDNFFLIFFDLKKERTWPLKRRKKTLKMRQFEAISLTPLGVLTPWSTHAGPSAQQDISGNEIYMEILAHANWDPRSRVHECGTLCSVPCRHEQKFYAVHICRITFKHLPQLLRTHIRSFKNFKNLKKKLKKRPIRGNEGVPIFLKGYYLLFLLV